MTFLIIIFKAGTEQTPYKGSTSHTYPVARASSLNCTPHSAKDAKCQ